MFEMISRIYQIAGSSRKKITVGIPVSYTHLDVYKRQIFRLLKTIGTIAYSNVLSG